MTEKKSDGGGSGWTVFRTLLVGGGAALVIALFTYLIAPGFFQGIESRLYDMRVRLASQISEQYDGYESNLILIRIDDRSLKEYGRFSQWPREYHSRLAGQLADWGAAAIFYDIVFFQEDMDPQVDRRIAEGFSDAGIVYSAMSLVDSSSYVFMSTLDEQEVIDNNPLSVIPVESVRGADQLPDLSARRRQVLEGPIPRITRASMGLGLVNAFPDEDGVVRRQSLLSRNGDYLLPTASLRLFLDLAGIKFDEIEVVPGEFLRVGNFKFPIDSQGRYLMHWYPMDAPPYMEISYYDVLEGRVPGEFFSGKVVVVGPTAAALGDIKPTPADPALAGVKIHTTLFSNMALGHAVTPMGDTLGIILTVFLGAVAAFFSFRFRISIGSLLTAALFIIWIVASVWTMVQWSYWMELFRPAFGLVVGYTGAMVYRYMTEEKQKRVIKGAFQQYVSPAVVDEMLDDPDKLQLGGERRNLTILFADIQGFTSFSEKLEPEELTHFLNKFLTVMTNRIFEFQGTVDKYIGDAIMAIFGAPLPFDDHAAKALDSALGMHAELDNVRAEWGDFLPEKFDLKLGLNTGPVVVGNMGSDVRFDYTVLGDNVNLAARLEALTRQYGVSLLISESTREAVGSDFLVRELDGVKVKGKNKPVVIFEVIARKGSAQDTEENQRLAEQFAEALRLYRMQKWDEALEIFSTLEDDPASRIFAERCDHLKMESPGDGWDGVWTMTTK